MYVFRKYLQFSGKLQQQLRRADANLWLAKFPTINIPHVWFRYNNSNDFELVESSKHVCPCLKQPVGIRMALDLKPASILAI